MFDINQLMTLSLLFAASLADKIKFEDGEDVMKCERGHSDADASTFQVCSIQQGERLSIIRASDKGNPLPERFPFNAKRIYICRENKGPIFEKGVHQFAVIAGDNSRFREERIRVDFGSGPLGASVRLTYWKENNGEQPCQTDTFWTDEFDDGTINFVRKRDKNEEQNETRWLYEMYHTHSTWQKKFTLKSLENLISRFSYHGWAYDVTGVFGHNCFTFSIEFCMNMSLSCYYHYRDPDRSRWIGDSVALDSWISNTAFIKELLIGNGEEERRL